MKAPTNLFFAVLLLAAVAAATATAVRPKRGGLRKYVFTPHAKVVAGICRHTEDKRLCCRTLKHIPTDDPVELIRALVSAAETAVKKSLTFLAGLKPKYKGYAFATSCINSCQKQLNYSMMEFEDFWLAAGKNLTSMAVNYYTCTQSMRQVFTYHAGCLNDIYDEKVLKVVEGGIGLGKNLSGEAMDVFVSLNDILKSFGIKVKLVEQDTNPLLPPPLSYYYY